jgi:aryl-alcohol dehydrogenase-like predicted oxidoreductase
MTTSERRRLWLEDGLREVETLGFLVDGRTIGQAAIQFALYQPAVAAVLPNTYNAAMLEEFATAAHARPLSAEDYGRVQALYARNFDLGASAAA